MGSGTYRPPPPGPLQHVLHFIDENLAGDLSLATLGRKAKLGARQLHRAFVAETGESPRAYVESRRVAAAARLLESSALPLAIVAERCGLAPGATFTRAFRRVIGVTPARYRATSRAASS